MEELAIKIKICGRVYPMKVQATDEKRVRTASNLINEQVRAYSDKFGIHDKQDLLAMVALDCLMDTLKSKDGATRERQVVAEKVDTLVKLVDQVLT
ncbi:MAG: cell division protein ZapA [Amoebophilaceae bacterium]|jgi:cell division protein ZapA|nr:cell division protein ZapA [Amoebophilaceae bacterium]